MGAQMEKIFKIVEEQAGTAARIELASKTGISRKKALELDDNPDDVAALKNVAAQITGLPIDELPG
jgi:hypothetical protein